MINSGSENRDYWLSRDGRLYAEQQRIRRELNNVNYEMQERWLQDYLRKLAAAKEGPISVLDFGCGFGRMTHLLSEIDGVHYYGFDISTAMVQPLLDSPPASLADIIHERIAIGEDLPWGPESFDVIFTVSVLIHNNRQQARSALEAMRHVLRKDGEICLIENKPVSIDILGNRWHAGCWTHDYAFTLAQDFELDVDGESFPDHGLYVLRPAESSEARCLRWFIGGQFVPVSRAEYLDKVHENTIAAVRTAESEFASKVEGAVLGKAHDADEMLHAAERAAEKLLEKVRETRPELLEGAASDSPMYSVVQLGEQLVDRIRDETERSSADAERLAVLERQLDLREKIRAALLGRTEKGGVSHGSSTSASLSTASLVPPPYELDSARDTMFTRSVPGFDKVCHLFHQQWFGIRAAAGALPGHKLAIDAGSSPTSADLEDVSQWLQARAVERLVVHGFSLQMTHWIRGLREAGFDHVYLVWHGAPVMWVHTEERKFFSMALKMAHEGLIRRIQCMRGGSDVTIGEVGWRPQIYNVPPFAPSLRRKVARRRDAATAFSPSWNLVHKNLMTNVAAAVHSPSVGKVWVLADDFHLPYTPGKPIERLPKLDARQMLQTMSLADLVLNVSIVDCHPMVELEALAVGTPSIRGRLGLDALEDHPYVRCTQVEDPLSVSGISEAISRVLSIDHSEMDGMMDSYCEQLTALAATRYADFLEI
ncbi:methyltransferase domain-containing protein [Xanthomonas sp. F4]|nr:class I SAM-dependent methyltransferase [Xanthomonas sp. LMG 9002]